MESKLYRTQHPGTLEETVGLPSVVGSYTDIITSAAKIIQIEFIDL